MSKKQKITKYEYLSHTADMAIKGYGKDLAELFVNIAEGMYEAVIGDKISKTKNQISKTQTKNIKIEGETSEDLLINFLNELIYIIETDRKILKDIKISKIKKGELEFSALPYPLPHEKIEIKAATYHDLKIKKVNNNYTATVIFDI